MGRRERKRSQGGGLGTKLPTVTPNAKCKLRLLKMERIKDWLLLEEEFVTNQQRLKPQEERAEEDRSKASDAGLETPAQLMLGHARGLQEPHIGGAFYHWLTLFVLVCWGHHACHTLYAPCRWSDRQAGFGASAQVHWIIGVSL